MSKRFIVASVLFFCKHAAADEQACTTSVDCENVSHYCIDGTCRELPHAVPTERYLALHVSGDAGGRLEYAELLSGPWTTLCVTPCTAYGRSKGVYRLTAGGSTSHPLVLADRVDDLQLHATVGYRSYSELALAPSGRCRPARVIVVDRQK